MTISLEFGSAVARRLEQPELLLLNRLARRLLKNLGKERVTQIVDKERCYSIRIFPNYFMLVAFILPHKFSKIVLAV